MKRLALALICLLWAGAVHAQIAGVRVVTTCGNPSPWQPLQTSYQPFAVWLSVDTTMTLCTIGGGGGGGGGAVTLASGAVAAGAYSAGAFVSGSFLSGTYADGAIVGIGALADTAWSSGNGSVIAVLKKIAGNTATFSGAVTIAAGADVSEGNITDTPWTGTGNSTVIAALKAIWGAVTGSIPAGSAIVGKVGIDQTTPGTTNGIQINAALPAGTNLMGKVGIDQTTPGTTNGVVVNNTNANGQASAANSSPVVLPVAQVTVDPCTLGAKINLPISTNATALTQIIALSGSTKIYICSINLVAPAATAFNLIGGTGTACAASTLAIIGSTTAANGMSWAANGGFTLGNGAGTVAVTAAGSELCTLQSTAVQVAGNLTYVQQ